MPDVTKHFGCYVIGSDNLLIQCAEVLLKAGYEILGIISSNSNVRVWAKENNISFEENINNLLSTQFDYLFSIVNDKIIPAKILKTPRYLAINYHDSLLPKYAGTHATSWAILNGEKQHGITWHVMNEIIDGGEIVKQVVFDIDENETTLSLNLKCYEHAIQSFKELINELSRQKYQYIAQDFKQHTFYATHQKPPSNGWISWHQPASAINRLCRALTFGPYPNKLGTAKCVLNKAEFIVTETFLLEEISQSFPGTITKIAQDYLQISTTTCDIAISKLLPLDSESHSITEICQRHNIYVGLQLLSPTENESLVFVEKSEQSSKKENFWLQQLENFQPADLPFFSKSESNLSSQQKLYETVKLNAYDNKRLSSLLQSRATASEILLTTWLIYLYRLNNQEHLGIGLNSNKFFVADYFLSKKVPLSLQFHDEMKFADCLQMIKKQLALYKDAGYFLGDIYQRYPVLANYNKKYPISLTIQEKGEKLSLDNDSLVNVVIVAATKSISFFSSIQKNENFKAILKNIPGHITTIIKAVIKNPNQKIAYLPLLTASEQQQILIDWNQTETDFPLDKTVHQLFEEQAKKTSGKVAVIFEDQQLTYKELNKRANQLAHYLRKLGVKPETLVAIYLDRGLEMIVGILGILKAGGAYVPIDPEYPEVRIRYMLEDSKAPVIITKKLLLPLLPIDTIASKMTVLLDQDINSIKKESVDNPKNLNISANLIYVIYTSGSTGRPKGVEVIHRGVIRLVKNSNYIKIGKKDCVGQASNPSFDAATFEIWGALLNGAKLVIIQKTELLDNNAFSRCITENQVSVLWLTFSLFNQFVSENLDALYSIKNLLIGGEAVTTRAVKIYLKNRKDVSQRLINGYGPTETTTFATSYLINQITDQALVPIGKPITATQVYILDEKQQLLPVGVVGELYIGGKGLARGYLNYPKLTQEKFIHNPFTTKHNTRLYRAGDLVRWLPSGDIDYVGRIDHQVKIRGYRIELEEIEKALVTHENIAQTIVLVQMHKEQKQLICFFIKKNELKALNQSELRSFLEKILPPYMIPNKFINIKSIPLTANGKVDRETLLNIDNKNLKAIKNQLSPKTDLELLLRNIWQEIFKLDNILLNDNFFALGGDSILAMQLVARARQHGFKLSIKEIFSYPTIAGLANIMQRNISEKKLGNSKGNFPLTPIQRWFFEQPLVARSQWSQVCLLDISQPLNPTILEKSFLELISQHETLRLRFQKINEGWQQHFKKQSFLFKKIIKLSERNSQKINALVELWKFKLQQNFNLNEGPLAGYVLFQTSNKSILLTCIHHLLIDGISWRILLEDLTTFYQYFLENKKLALPYKTSSFNEWSKALYQYLDSRHFQEDKMYWFKQPKKKYEIHIDYLHGDNTEDSTKEVEGMLSKKETSQLIKQVSQECQINDILITILAKTFEEWTNKDDLFINLESHGRVELKNLNLSRTIGWFTSLYPLYLKWNKSKPILEMLQIIKNKLATVPNNGIGYGLIRYLKDNQNQQLLDYAPISFNYWGQFDQIFPQKSKFRFKWLRLVSGLTNPRAHLLDINCLIQDGKFKIFINYSKNLYKLSTIKKLVENYLNSLRRLIDELASVRENKDFAIDKSMKVITTKNKVIIEKIYPLSPMQKGLLFHTLRSPNSDAYVVQLNYTFNRELNVAVFCRSMQLLIDRHDILRTIFKWDETNEPKQLVERIVELNWQYYNWQTSSKEHHADRLEKFLKADRQVGFDFTRSPLMRLTLIQLSKESYQIIITLHHILIDGWSLPIIFKELNQIYLSYIENKSPQLATIRPYSDYVKFLQIQDLTTAKIFWRNYLKEYCRSTDLIITKAGYKEDGNAASDYHFQCEILSRQFTKTIEQFAKQNKLTLSCVFYGVWAILLSQYSQTDDVVFGVTISGRPPELHNSEQMVGIFINTLPLRIKFSKKTTVLDCLQSIQSDLSEIISYHYTPLSNIEEWLNFSSGMDLFKCIVGFESYPVNQDEEQFFSFKNVQIIDPTHYPLTFVITPGKRIVMKINYDQNAIEKNVIHGVIEHLKNLLLKLTEHPDLSIYNLKLLAEKEQKQILINSGQHDKETKNFSKIEMWSNQKLLIDEGKSNNKLPDYIKHNTIPLIQSVHSKIEYQKLCKNDFLQDTFNSFSDIIGIEEGDLIDIFEKTLNIKNVSLDDNFFRLGGHSIAALQVLSEIRVHYGVDLPVRSFFENPTINGIAEMIKIAISEKNAIKSVLQPLPNSFSSLIAFQTKGTKIPLFLIHPIGGTVFWYAALAKYCDPQRPFYGIQDPGIESKIVPFKSVEEIATAYIEVIRSVQPSGPYLIGGASAGAITSVEIAYQLQQQGEIVSFVGLLDGWVPMPYELLNQEFFEANMRRQYNSMREKFLAKNIDRAEVLLNLQWQRIQMYERYKVPILHNKLTLFKAKEIIPIYQTLDAPMNHWDSYSSEIEVHLVPGDHESMFQEPNVCILAKKLNECLNNLFPQRNNKLDTNFLNMEKLN